MGKSKVERIPQPQPQLTGKAGDKRQSLTGSGWVRVSYERDDGRVQVKYFLFDSRGRVHCVFDWSVQTETKRWPNNVDEASRIDRSDVRVSMVRE